MRGGAHCSSRAVWRGLGVLLCFGTVYPPVTDAATLPHPGGIGMAAILQALASPALALAALPPPVLVAVPGSAEGLLVLLLARPLSLLRSPGGFFAAAAGLVGFVLFFGLLYPVAYRHAAL